MELVRNGSISVLVLTCVIKKPTAGTLPCCINNPNRQPGRFTCPDKTQWMLPNDIYHRDHSTIYPGEYQPILGQDKELSDELKSGTGVTNPPVNVVMLNGYYRVEMPAPGFKREDFQITTNGELLSVRGITRKHSKNIDAIPGFHGFHYKCIKRDIVLPFDVDTEFATAEYANGILCICLFRTNFPAMNRPSHIIVY